MEERSAREIDGRGSIQRRRHHPHRAGAECHRTRARNCSKGDQITDGAQKTAVGLIACIQTVFSMNLAWCMIELSPCRSQRSCAKRVARIKRKMHFQYTSCSVADLMLILASILFVSFIETSAETPCLDREMKVFELAYG